jgi:hypothetical protein
MYRFQHRNALWELETALVLEHLSVHSDVAMGDIDNTRGPLPPPWEDISNHEYQPVDGERFHRCGHSVCSLANVDIRRRSCWEPSAQPANATWRVAIRKGPCL